MITRKAGPALAAGCTIVIKPAAETPLCALALAVLAEQAGIPAGVINIVTSHQASAVGNELCSNPVVRKLSFTGSTRIGKLLMRQCADTMKRLSSSLAATPPSSSLTTPTSTPPWPGPWRPNTATPARPASAPTASGAGQRL